MHRTTWNTLCELSLEHDGVIGHQMAVARGVSAQTLWNLRRRKEIAAIRPGASRLPSTPAGRRLAIRAAVLVAGEGAAASHFTAAELHALEGIPHRSRIEVVVPIERHPRLPGATLHRSGLLLPEHVSLCDGIPTTTIPRTLADLSGWVPDDRLGRAAREACRHLGVVVPEVRGAALALLPQGGRGRRRPLLEQRIVADEDFDPGGSEPELALHEFLVSEGFRPVQQFRIVLDGHPLFIDDAFPPEKVALEYQGRDGHKSYDIDWECERMALLAEAGWLVVPVTKTTDRRTLVERLRRILDDRRPDAP